MCLIKKQKTYLARYDPYTIEDRIETEEGEEVIYKSHVFPRRLRVCHI